MDFTRVNLDTSPEDMNEEELRGSLREFMDAQESNIAAFKELAEEVDGDLSETVADFSEFRDELIEETAEAGPLSEDELQSLRFSRVRELHAEFVNVEEEAPEDEAEAEEAGPEFEDMGSRGETHGEDKTPEFARDLIAGIPGVVLKED